MTNTPVQVFCDICSKGVLVHKSSMYKCRVCGKQVCSTCWISRFNKCKLCAKHEMEEEERKNQIQREVQEQRKEHERVARKNKEETLTRLENKTARTGSAMLIIAFLCFMPGMPLLINKIPWWLIVGTAVSFGISGAVKLNESSRYTDARNKLSK